MVAVVHTAGFDSMKYIFPAWFLNTEGRCHVLISEV